MSSIRNLAVWLGFGSLTVAAWLNPTFNIKVEGAANVTVIVKMHGMASVGVGPS